MTKYKQNQIKDLDKDKELLSASNALRQIRRDNKKSILKGDDGTFLTSIVYTDPNFAKKIIQYFSPQFKPDDTFLDPTAGKKAFYKHLPKPKDWCEIQDGRDFLDWKEPVDWIFCNLPWRGKWYSRLAEHTFQVADNVVSLVKFSTAIGTNKRFRDAKKHQMNMKEIIFVDWKEANFTFHDGSIKQPEGFILAVIHWQKNWEEGTVWTDYSKRFFPSRPKERTQ